MRGGEPEPLRERLYAPVNRYSVRQASLESVWAVQKSSAMLSGSKSVAGLTAPAIVTVAAWMPSSRTPAAISVPGRVLWRDAYASRRRTT